MFDLLRVARVARTVLGLVGGWRSPAFRAFAVVVTCAGVGFTLAGPSLLGVFIAVALWLGVFIVRSRGGVFGT